MNTTLLLEEARRVTADLHLLLLEVERQETILRELHARQTAIAERRLRETNSKLAVVAVIKDHIVAEFGISLEQLRCKRGGTHISWPRQVAMYLTTMLTALSQSNIDEEFGKKHGAVSNACQRVKDRMDTEPMEKARVERLLKELKEKTEFRSRETGEVKANPAEMANRQVCPTLV